MADTNNDQDMLFNSKDEADPESQPNPVSRHNIADREDVNPRPAQCVRRDLIPHDNHLQDTVVFNNVREFFLAALQRDNAIFQELFFCYLDVQILCLIVINNNNQASVYKHRRNNNNNQ